MFPTLASLTKYQNQYPYVPVVTKQKLTNFDPVVLAQLIRERGDGFALTIAHQRRYSYFSFQVTHQLETAGTPVQRTSGTAELQQLLDQYRTPQVAGVPPFTGGLMGYFSYEFVQQFQKRVQFTSANPLDLPARSLMFVTSVLVYDHQHHELGLTRLLPTATLATSYAAAQRELPAQLCRVIKRLQRRQPLPPMRVTRPLRMRIPRATYVANVERIKQHIRAGDIFQMIYANPQIGRMSGSLLRVYQQLVTQSTSPYEFYFRRGDFETVVASPETLVTKTDQQIATYPLAGTRRRGRTPQEDQQLARELTRSPKEIAEHNMLVDLGRNDLGQVAKFKSVRVTNLRRLIKFSQVMHMGSRVAAEVQPDKTALDVLAATFPAGTLAGAPKVKAMSLIDHYEQTARGIYGGCFGYLDCNGNLDVAIGIRLAYRQADRLVVPSGAGIVADSVGSQEYQECQNKARVVVNAIDRATGVRTDAAIN